MIDTSASSIGRVENGKDGIVLVQLLLRTNIRGFVICFYFSLVGLIHSSFRFFLCFKGSGV